VVALHLSRQAQDDGLALRFAQLGLILYEFMQAAGQQEQHGRAMLLLAGLLIYLFCFALLPPCPGLPPSNASALFISRGCGVQFSITAGKVAELVFLQ
jgi:hypothetical protein